LTKTSKSSPNNISGILSKKKIILKKLISRDKNEISIGRNNSSRSLDSLDKNEPDHKDLRRENIDREDK
jgi:hypothetical protein